MLTLVTLTLFSTTLTAATAKGGPLSSEQASRRATDDRTAVAKQSGWLGLARERSAYAPATKVESVTYWRSLAQKRLRLLGRREHRIVELLKEVQRWHGPQHRTASTRTGVRGVICSVFGAHCSEALRVAWCESRMNVHATNGDYWGLFQFGSFAREHYGFGWDALKQARAAYRYFLAAGWSPWTCRP